MDLSSTTIAKRLFISCCSHISAELWLLPHGASYARELSPVHTSDIVAKNRDIVAETGNNPATLLPKTQCCRLRRHCRRFRRHCRRFRRQCRRFWRQCRRFWRHCRWCGRGFSRRRVSVCLSVCNTPMDDKLSLKGRGHFHVTSLTFEK